VKEDTIRLGLTAVSSPLEAGAADAPQVLEDLHRELASAPFARRFELLRSMRPATDPASAAEIGRYFYDQRVDGICVVATSWFEDYLVLDMLEECDAPVITWARPGMETGALCGVQQVDMVLKQLERSYLFLFDEVTSPVALQAACDCTLAAGLRRRLRRARIAYLGHRVEGMTETTPHELALKKIFGPRLVSIDTQVFLDEVARNDAQLAAERWQQLRAQVGRVTACDQAGVEALQVYAALKDTMERGRLSAVAVDCYPHLMGKVCLANSLLAEQGIPVACEGDVNGALGMLMLTYLSGQAVHNTDILDPVPAENSIVFSHCGSGGFSLAAGREHIVLGPVRLMNRGVCCLFPARPGPVTLINLVPTMAGYRMGVLCGEAIETDMIFPGNPLRVRFSTDYREILAWIAQQGLGHHWMAAYGDFRVPLHHLASMTGCEWLNLA
jgi:L-fucose isomerase-like protein